MYLKKILPLFLIISATQLQAQNFLKQLGELATDKIGEKGTDMRGSIDSIDFQFAISINQGAGFFDIEQKGETFSKVLYGFKEQEDKTPLDLARDSLEIAIGLYNIRRYEMSEYQTKRTLEYMESSSLEDEVVYLRVISNLGLINLTQGKIAEATAYINQALSKAEEQLGSKSMAYLANLNNLAKKEQLLGEYTKAEKMFDEALELSKENYDGSMQQAIILNNKAMLYQTIGQYERAIDLMKQANNLSNQAIKKPLQGERSFDNRKFQANLAFVYQAAKQYQKAEAILLELKKIAENRRQTKNAEYAALVNQLGILYIQMNRYEKVRGLFVEALNVYKKRWGENNIYFAKTAMDLGNFHRIQGQYEDAQNWLTKSFDIRKSLLNNTHPAYVESQESLAILYWKMNQPERAYPLYQEVMDQTMTLLHNFFPAMSEAEKTHYWDITSPRFQRFYNFAISYLEQKPELTKTIFEYNLDTKGILLSNATKIRNQILASNNEGLIADYLAWQDQKDQLARLYSYSKAKLKSQKIDLKQLEAEANQLEKSISERSANFAGTSPVEIDLAGFKSKLNPQEAIVDMIRVNKYDQDFTGESTYLALILDATSTRPILIEIPDGNLLEGKSLLRYRNSIKHKIEDTHSYANFWGAIEPHIIGKSKIYFSPDGVYNQVNINTLQTQNDQYLIDKYNIVMVGNAKDIIQNQQKSTLTKNAFLLGYPDYQTDEVTPLPGTQVEIESISKLLANNGFKLSKNLSESATEDNLKKIDNPGVVHIATHGYFQPDEEVSNESSFGVHYDNAKNNPLLRSGLLLANVGQSLIDTVSTDITVQNNGILTAYEAINLDLTHTELVVLSACETGLGEIKAGEGVYGLQRAFQIAGANSLIMSLWKVNDEATQKLMSAFYTNWMSGMKKHQAFHQAQLKLKKEFKNPYNWGAFVMIGE
ncbi:CHAT domain-containing protein [Reichenbachiella faecimaris]|nr:CHAT domain-containing tetratricopeptide repeat protein [Reichenbachiella faecimaris]